MRNLVLLLASFFLLAGTPLAAQNNPYLDRKNKNKPSVRMARETKKDLKKQKKAAKKQMRKSKRSISRADRRRMKGN
jgi:hypothetical protein